VRRRCGAQQTVPSDSHHVRSNNLKVRTASVCDADLFLVLTGKARRDAVAP